MEQFNFVDHMVKNIWDNPLFIILPCSSLKYANACPSTYLHWKTHHCNNQKSVHKTFLLPLRGLADVLSLSDMRLRSSGHSWNVDLNHTRARIAQLVLDLVPTALFLCWWLFYFFIFIVTFLKVKTLYVSQPDVLWLCVCVCACNRNMYYMCFEQGVLS